MCLVECRFGGGADVVVAVGCNWRLVAIGTSDGPAYFLGIEFADLYTKKMENLK